ncbi:MAG: hypothetical protein UV98_C0006G0001 [Parcubacteria group bacterium GW2011_GWB1_43_6]|nr:MAG: hypothetical protein UV98_C0006G0001 [Parcubacteria group bacterium GW2011_GWB1_43_6]
MSKTDLLIIAPGEIEEISVITPGIQALAVQLGWRPETAVARIKKALPARFAQSAYLAMVDQWGVVLPESFAQIADYFTRGQGLREADLTNADPGIRESLEATFDQIAKTVYLVREAREINADISIETATRLVAAYGDEAEKILEIILDAIPIALAYLPQWKRKSKALTNATIVKIVAFHACEGAGRGGLVNIVDIDGLVQLISSSAFFEILTDDDEEVRL